MRSENQAALDVKEAMLDAEEATLKAREKMLEAQEASLRTQMRAFDSFETKLGDQWRQLDSLVSASRALIVEEFAEPVAQDEALNDKEATLKAREKMLEAQEAMLNAREIKLDLLVVELGARRQRLESVILKLRAIKAKFEGIEQAPEIENDGGETEIEQTPENDNIMAHYYKILFEDGDDDGWLTSILRWFEANDLIDRMISEIRVQLNPELSIDRLCLSARPRHLLEWSRIYTIDQLKALSRSDLLNIQGLGPKSVNEIADKLKALTGFELPD